MSVTALVSLKREKLPAVGRERVRLLEAVAREGSISAGARAVGLTYRGAWDALDAMAQVFARPLVETRSGGRDRGGARLTPAGARVIAAFHRLDAEMTRLSRAFDADMAEIGAAPRSGGAGAVIQTSARNALRGKVTALRRRGLICEVEAAVGPSLSVIADVTHRSVEALGLHESRDVLALIKAPFVAVIPPDGDSSARNRLPGVVRRIETSGDQAEVALDLGGGMTLAALIGAAAATRLREDGPALACFDPAQVILAIE